MKSTWKHNAPHGRLRAAEIPVLSEGANMTHCWKDYREHIEETCGVGSDAWNASFDRSGGTCMLPEGHDGPHEFTADDQIMVVVGEDNAKPSPTVPGRR